MKSDNFIWYEFEINDPNIIKSINSYTRFCEFLNLTKLMRSFISFKKISVIMKEEPDTKIITDKEINKLSIVTKCLRIKLDMKRTDAAIIPG
jgi:hypothetical protein